MTNPDYQIASRALDRAEWYFSVARDNASRALKAYWYFTAALEYRRAARLFREFGARREACECDRARSIAEDAARDSRDSLNGARHA